MSEIQWPESLPSLVKTLAPDDKARFFDLFWEIWAASGFGTLSKRDTDLLVFHCLRQAIDRTGARKSHDWANLLRITQSRYRSLRLESHIRFRHLRDSQDMRSDLELLLEQLKDIQRVEISGVTDGSVLDSVKIQFVVEDPVVRMDLEYRAKSVGGYVDFQRNREIVVIRLSDFLKIMVAETGDPLGREAVNNLIDSWVSERSEKQEATLRDRIEAAEYLKMSQSQRLLYFAETAIGAATGGKADTVIKMLHRVFDAKSERKNTKIQKRKS
jgi:hypothetical protein